uniref:Uncharacterized protein n=1 Tax=Tanacetum cinerariifolium TaxID=118510 RepID=A0A6L2P1N5_TANCI|nr:hypothetical protein [Tanacetum cinerariifolium]
MRDTTAQTRFESVSKHSNDSLLVRGNTLRSDEDILKLDELMALCTNLQNRVLDLEKTKTTQFNKIASLIRRVKKLEKINRSRTHGLKRLYKIALSAMVKSYNNKESLGEDASKQERRIDAIDADEDISLVSVQDDADKEMFDVNVLDGEEVFVVGQNENVVEEVVNATQVSTVARTAAITTEEITLSQVLEALKTSKPKKRRKHFAAKRAEEKRNKPPTKAQEIHIMCTYLKNMEGYKLKDLKLKEFDYIHEMFDKAFKKVDDDKEKAELKKLMETIPDEEEVSIDAIPLAVKSPIIVDWKIHKEGKKSYYQIVRADGKSQMYMTFSQMLKSSDIEDLEDLYKTFIDDAVYAGLHVGREEVSFYIIDTFNVVRKEAPN